MKRLSKPSGSTVLIVLLGCSLISALFGQRVARPLRGLMQYVLVPPGDGAMYFVTYFKRQIGRGEGRPLMPREARRLREQNEQLRRQVYSLLEQRDQWWERATVVKELRGLLGARFAPSRDLPYDIIAARVVADESLPYGAGRLLTGGRGRGARDGAPVTAYTLQTDRAKAIEPAGSAVLDPQILRKHRYRLQVTGSVLVGRLTHAGEFSAGMHLVTDRGFRIDARIRRQVDRRHPRMVVPREGGQPRPLTLANSTIDVVAQGDGKGSVSVPHVDSKHAVRPRGWRLPGEGPAGDQRPRRGDWLVTRGDGTLLPVEVGIGEVVEVTPDPEHPGFVTVRVEPFVDLSALRDVYIIVPRKSSRGGGG